MITFTRKILLTFTLLLVVLLDAKASYDSPDTNQQFYYLIDLDTKEVLAEKNSDVQIPPSSMTKVMTAFVAFDLIEKNLLTLDKQCKIGYDSWRKSGSSMFLNHGDLVSMDTLLQGLLAVSGNDAAVAIAKNAAGSVEEFAALMNKTAKRIGLKDSHFMNPHGLYEKGHYMSLRDLATLAINFYEKFPQYTHYLSIPKFTYENITQYNRNPLMKNHYEGIVAGKTGHTNQGGYGVLGIVKRDNRRLVGVINKARTPQQRTNSIIKLFDYGFNNYKQLTLYKKGQKVANLKTWLGAKNTVGAIVKDDVIFNTRRDTNIKDIKAKVNFLSPIYAPITQDTKIADLIITVDKNKKYTYPLFAEHPVKKAGFFTRMRQVLRHKVNNFLR
ncbi:MAG: D-alanyl-D-alanine carboxypeptidase [Rickettsiales bacterium]|nr:D-alanyl-D-alanine carboxypeptidase [Rickettsiales bacterium]